MLKNILYVEKNYVEKSNFVYLSVKLRSLKIWNFPFDDARVIKRHFFFFFFLWSWFYVSFHAVYYEQCKQGKHEWKRKSGKVNWNKLEFVLRENRNMIWISRMVIWTLIGQVRFIIQWNRIRFNPIWRREEENKYSRNHLSIHDFPLVIYR